MTLTETARSRRTFFLVFQRKICRLSGYFEVLKLASQRIDSFLAMTIYFNHLPTLYYRNRVSFTS